MLFCFALAGMAQAQSPGTVLHIVNVKWKDDATPEQVQAVLDAVHDLPAKFPGIKRVWTKNLDYQGEFSQAIVMEFESQDALKRYAGSPAQKAWYKLYLPVRDDSWISDVSN